VAVNCVTAVVPAFHVLIVPCSEAKTNGAAAPVSVPNPCPPDAGLAGGPGRSRRAWEDRHHQRLRNTGTVVKRGQGGHLIRDPERGGGGIGPCPITAPVMDAQELDND